MKTSGVSPKLVAAVITAVVTYVLGQEVLELSPVVTVIGQAVLIALAAFVAPPGTVTAPSTPAHVEASEPRDAIARSIDRKR